MKKILKSKKLIVIVSVFCLIVVFSVFFKIDYSFAAVQFTADTTISLTNIIDGDLSVASSSQANSLSILGTALTVSAIPDGSFFTLKTTSHNNALKITPTGGTLDLTFDSTNFSSGNITQWTLTGTNSTQVAHIIGTPLANTWYAIKIDGTLLNSYQSNSSAEASFTYSGGWSTKVFTIEADSTAPTSFSLTSPANNTNISESQPTFSWNASTDPDVSYYQLYINGSIDTDNISSVSIKSSNSLSCGVHTWYVVVVDNAGNSTNSDTFTLTLACGGGIFTGSLPVPVELTPRLQTVYPDGTVVYHDEEDFTLPSVSVSDNASDLQNLESSTVQETTLSEEQTQTITTTYTFTKTLRKTQQNQEITKLQQILRELNFFTYPTNTGYYGTITETAVKQFQCNQNIVCTGTPNSTGYGLVGPKTRKALNSLQKTQIKEERKTEESIQTKTEEEQITELEKQIGEMVRMVEELQRELMNI